MEILESIGEKLQRGDEFVMVTVTDIAGSAPGKQGFRMLVYTDRIEGTVGGGALEKKVIETARGLFQTRRKTVSERINLSVLGMTCGGEASLFFELFSSKPQLWIFGGGHIALALTPMAAAAGFSITVADEREEFAQRARFPQASKTVCDSYTSTVRAVPDGAFAVIVTHGHVHDEQLLGDLAVRQPPLSYIGMIGSRKKVAAVFSTLKSKGVARFDTIFSPIGLDLGGDTPGEIALAIAAELLAFLHKKEATPHRRIDASRL